MNNKLQEQYTVAWTKKNKNHYMKLGYKFTKLDDKFVALLNDILCTEKIYCTCEYCNKIFAKAKNKLVYNYKRYSEECPSLTKLCCTNCKSKKVKECNLEKYGVKNVFQLSSTKNKIQNTLKNKYGEDIINPGQISEIREKVKQTNLEKYGVENVFQADEIKNKIKNTWINNYGVDHPMKNENIKNIAINNSFKALYNNGTGMCSSQQKYIYNILGGKLNYPIDGSKFILDIAFPDQKLYIEYDGSGHDLGVRMGKNSYEELEQKDRYREIHMKNLGWKIIRIISNKDKLPNKDNLKELLNKYIDYLMQTKHTWIYINIDDQTIYGNNLKDKLDYELIKIKKEKLNEKTN